MAEASGSGRGVALVGAGWTAGVALMVALGSLLLAAQVDPAREREYAAWRVAGLGVGLFPAPAQVLDVTAEIREGLPEWESETGLPRDFQQLVRSTARGDDMNLSYLTNITAHLGTHVDKPGHFLQREYEIKHGVDVRDMLGPALLLQVPDSADQVTAEVLEGLNVPRGTERLLLRTRNTSRRLLDRPAFDEGFVGVSECGARWLVGRRQRDGLRLVGIDYLSIATYRELVSVHRQILSAGILVLETLNLTDAAPGLYGLVALPIRTHGVEGALTRALLVR